MARGQAHLRRRLKAKAKADQEPAAVDGEVLVLADDGGETVPAGPVPSAADTDVMPDGYRVRSALATIGGVTAEMGQVYRWIAQRRITLSQGTKLFYMLDKLARALTAKAALDRPEEEDQLSWTGYKIIFGEQRAPPGGEKRRASRSPSSAGSRSSRSS